MSFSHFTTGAGWLLGIVISAALIGLLAGAITAIPYWIANYRAKIAGVDKVDSMDGKMFEIWLAHQFTRAGYDVKRTPYQKDHGADLIVASPKGTKIAIQAKQSSSRNARIGAKALGEVLRGKDYYGCDKAMMVTNRGYTHQARDEAKRIGIGLMGRKELIEFAMKNVNKGK